MHKPERQSRPRALQACEVCRARKNRCSEDRPCTYCVEHDLECKYSRTPRDKRPRFVQQGSMGRAHREKRHKTSHQVPQNDEVAESFAGDSNLQGTSFQSRRNDMSMSSTKFDDYNASPLRSRTQNYSDDLESLPQERLTQPGILSGSYADDSAEAANHSIPTPQGSASEVIDTNAHTRNLEFYGGSSSVAFLRHVETISDSQATADAPQGSSERSLASLLHNTEFRPNSAPNTPISERNSHLDSSRFYFRIARKFLDAYFSNIHHIQPLFDEQQFLNRCEDLWFERPEKQPKSFIALYYATLSLGSLVMVWEDRDPYGADRFAWSRKLFNEALSIVTQLGTATDIEMVQCYYMLGKVCQHELNPHVAYLYSGGAARTALAIGINRRPVDGKQSDPRASLSASMTWWAIYCLDIQTSFALGRPDSLGPDEYHTQTIPGAMHPNSQSTFSSNRMLQITPFMVNISRIMRRVGLKLYTTPCTIEERLIRAKELDIELETWLRSLPVHLLIADQTFVEPSLKPRNNASYALKQSVVLKLRYHNLRMVIHGVFMTLSESIDSDIFVDIRDCRQRCIESACRAIDLMYNTFRTDNFFQTWWYNATYALFAVSILLTAIFHKFSTTIEALDDLFSHIDRAIAVLQAMDECLVARNATAIIKRALCRAKKVTYPDSTVQDSSFAQPQPNITNTIWDTTDIDRGADSSMFSSAVVMEGNMNNTVDEDLNWFNSFPAEDAQQALFWTEWAHELDVLGT